MARVGVELAEAVSRLERLFPARLAASWDNVGLLLSPAADCSDDERPARVRVALLTNDLTRPVLDEAVSLNVDLLVSYHPPLFRPVQRLCAGVGASHDDWKTHVLVTCLQRRMAVFSPHTSADSVVDGVNDWLCDSLAPLQASVPLQPSDDVSADVSVKLTAVVDCQMLVDKMRAACAGEKSAQLHVEGAVIGDDQERRGPSSWSVSLIANIVDSRAVARVRRVLDATAVNYQLQLQAAGGRLEQQCGSGRLACLQQPLSLDEAVRRVKQHVGLNHVRLARAINVSPTRQVRTVAVCAGSGGSLLVPPPACVDLLVSGEMSHHQLLDAVHAGCHVVLCEHSNSERGYLRRLAAKLRDQFGGHVDVHVSQADRDPVEVV